MFDVINQKHQSKFSIISSGTYHQPHSSTLPGPRLASFYYYCTLLARIAS